MSTGYSMLPRERKPSAARRCRGNSADSSGVGAADCRTLRYIYSNRFCPRRSAIDQYCPLLMSTYAFWSPSHSSLRARRRTVVPARRRVLRGWLVGDSWGCSGRCVSSRSWGRIVRSPNFARRTSQLKPWPAGHHGGRQKNRRSRRWSGDHPLRSQCVARPVGVPHHGRQWSGAWRG